MTGPLLSLPSDIVLEIFSYLTQADVVECMLVSREWRSEVPRFTVEQWRQITVSRASWPKTNDSMLRCLGMHVKDVSIDNFDTKGVLAKLKEYNCQLIQLGIQYSRYRNDVNIDDKRVLVSPIIQFSESLERLSIVHVSASHLSPFDFLTQFPNLTHFTLLLNDPIPEYKSPPKTKTLCNKLKYLHLDINLNLEQAIVPVLEQCPQLAILLLSHFGVPPTDTPDDFDSIFTLCPHLTHLLLNEQISKDVYNDPVVNEWTAVPTNSKSNGLQQIIFRGHGPLVKTLEPKLAKCCKELERLQLYCEVNVLSHLSFPKLKKVSFRGVAMSDDEFRTLFQSFKAIESLDLVLTEASHMAILGEYITSWEHLRQVRLNSLAEPADDSEANEWNKTTFLADTRIEQLELTGIPLTDAGILNLCDIQSLKVLSLWISPNNCDISFEGLVAFADTLKAKDSRLDMLVISVADSLDDRILEYLAEVKHLSRLLIIGSAKITDAGVKAFIRGAGPGIKREMEVRQCRKVSRRGVWTADMC